MLSSLRLTFKLCNLQYPFLRKSVSGDHPYNFILIYTHLCLTFRTTFIRFFLQIDISISIIFNIIFYVLEFSDNTT